MILRKSYQYDIDLFSVMHSSKRTWCYSWFKKKPLLKFVCQGIPYLAKLINFPRITIWLFTPKTSRDRPKKNIRNFFKSFTTESVLANLASSFAYILT